MNTVWKLELVTTEENKTKFVVTSGGSEVRSILSAQKVRPDGELSTLDRYLQWMIDHVVRSVNMGYYDPTPAALELSFIAMYAYHVSLWVKR